MLITQRAAGGNGGATVYLILWGMDGGLRVTKLSLLSSPSFFSPLSFPLPFPFLSFFHFLPLGYPCHLGTQLEVWPGWIFTRVSEGMKPSFFYVHPFTHTHTHIYMYICVLSQHPVMISGSSLAITQLFAPRGRGDRCEEAEEGCNQAAVISSRGTGIPWRCVAHGGGDRCEESGGGVNADVESSRGRGIPWRCATHGGGNGP